MIKRIVMMEVLPEQEAVFINIFDNVKQQIRKQSGCCGLEVLRSAAKNRVNIWTISLWESEADLNNYRSSDLFEQAWAAVKPLFSAKTKAWTLNPIEAIP